MTVAMVVGIVALALVAGSFAVWVWVMARLDERKRRHEVDPIRRRTGPDLGHEPRHMRARASRW